MSKKTDDLEIKTKTIQVDVTPAKRFARLAGWMGFGIVCLIFFTLIKLPEDRIKAYIDGNISAVLADKGITFNATSGRLSFLFGISYTLKDITLSFPAPNPTIHIDKIQVAPSLTSLIFLTYAGKIWIENGKGDLSSSFSIKNTKFSFSYKANKLELQKLGILPYFAGVQAAATIDGSGSFSGDTSNLTSLEGEGGLALNQISLDPQSIAGFSIPQLTISDALADIKAEKGKATIKTLRIGKAGASKSGAIDDIQGVLTGDVTLAKSLDASQLNLKLKFSFSENILKSFVLLDALLGGGKQPDGSYSFTLTGPLTSPTPLPG